MDPMDCFIISGDATGCMYSRGISVEPSVFLVDDVSPTDGIGGQNEFLFDNYRDMDEFASPLTSSESSCHYTKEVFGLTENNYSFEALDTLSDFNGGSFGSLMDNLTMIDNVSAGTVHYKDTNATLNVTIKFGYMKHRYTEMVRDSHKGIGAFAGDIETQIMCDWDCEGEQSPADLTPDTASTTNIEVARHRRPGDKFNNDIDRSIEEFSRWSNDDIDTCINLEPNYFGLVALDSMKRDPAYRLLGAKPKTCANDYVNKLTKMSKINNDKYFSRINIHDLSHILGLDDYHISLTREIEVQVLKIFQFYCKFELGHKTWIRDTNKAQRKELVAKLHEYTSQWYPELTKFKLEVIIRRGSYSIMQRRLRRERRRKGPSSART